MCMIFLFGFTSGIRQIYVKTITQRYPEIFYTFEVPKYPILKRKSFYLAFLLDKRLKYKSVKSSEK